MKKQSGVYCIKNIKKLKYYIGSSNNLNKRRINHFSMLRNKTHHSINLQKAYNRSEDKNDFIFEILELCDEESLIEKENFWLNKLCHNENYTKGINKDFLRLSYNIVPIAY